MTQTLWRNFSSAVARKFTENISVVYFSMKNRDVVRTPRKSEKANFFQ